MRAPRYDTAVQLYRRTTTQDAYGEEIESWAAFGPLRPARVIEGMGREFLKAGQVMAESRKVFVIRFVEGASSAALQLTWQGRTFNVEDCTGMLSGGETWLHCRAIDGAN